MRSCVALSLCVGVKYHARPREYATSIVMDRFPRVGHFERSNLHRTARRPKNCTSTISYFSSRIFRVKFANRRVCYVFVIDRFPVYLPVVLFSLANGFLGFFSHSPTEGKGKITWLQTPCAVTTTEHRATTLGESHLSWHPPMALADRTKSISD